MSPKVLIESSHLCANELAERILASNGVKCTENLRLESDSSRPFNRNSYIAKGPWGRLENCTKSILGFGVGNTFNTIGVARFSRELVDELRSYCNNLGETGALPIDGAPWRSILELIATELAKSTRWTIGSVVPRSSFACMQSGRSKNTARDEASNRYVGLHLDCFEELAVQERWRGRNRFRINLGCSPRYLQFLTLPIGDMLNLLIESGKAKKEITEWGKHSVMSNLVAREFMAVFPTTPVLRLEIMPGEAYIAPTENLVHDGYVWSSMKDVTATFRCSVSINR